MTLCGICRRLWTVPIPELTVADRVAVCMKRHGDTAGALAEALHISRESIARRLHDKVNFQHLELLHLADRYDVPIEWLLGEQ